MTDQMLKKCVTFKTVK